MAEVISGTNVVLYKYDSDTMEDIPFACALSATMTIGTSVIEKTSASSARYKEFVTDMIEWSIEAEGFSVLNDQYNYRLITDLITDLQSFTIKFVVDNGGTLGLTIYSGEVIITNYRQTGGYDELSTYSVSLLGTGSFSTSGTVVTPGGSVIISGTTLQVFQYTAAGGETSIPFTGTVGLEAIYASRGGVTIQPIAYAGSPTAPNGGVWDTNTGQLNIDTGNPAFAGEYFLILAQ